MNQPVIDPLPVGQFLAMEIEGHGWTQADFAGVVGRPVQFVSEIVNGKKEITRESAAQISAALGHSPQFWLNFQDAFLLARQAESTSTQRDLSDVRRRARLNRLVPLSILRKRGVLHGTDLDDLETQVKDLLELPRIDAEPSFSIAARRSDKDQPISLVQRAWVGCVRKQAREHGHDLGDFSTKKAAMLAAELPGLLTTPSQFSDLPVIFAAAGIVLVYVEALPSAKIDGCAFMLENRPVVAISGRGKRLDIILWTLLHELAHLVLGHLSQEVLIDALDDHDESDQHSEAHDPEESADKRARGWLLPEPLPQAPARIGTDWVDAVARQRGLAPIVVVGQLQKRGALDWRTTLARNAPTVSDRLAAW